MYKKMFFFLFFSVFFFSSCVPGEGNLVDKTAGIINPSLKSSLTPTVTPTSGGGGQPTPPQPTASPTSGSGSNPTPSPTPTSGGGGGGGGGSGSCDDIKSAWNLNDTYLCSQWHLSNRAQQVPRLPNSPSQYFAAGTSGVDIKGFNTLKTHKGSGVKGYVTDNGVWKHNDLTGNLVGGYDNCQHKEDGQGTAYNGETHGTMVSGIISAVGNNGIGVSGIAPSAKFYSNNMVSSKCQGFTSPSEILASYNPASGFHYWSGSFGIPSCGSGHKNRDSAEYDAYNQGIGKNINYQKANGNGWGQCQEDGNAEPAGSHHGITHIAALDNKGIVTSYSTRGANLGLSCFAGYGGGGASPGIVTVFGTNNSDHRYTADMNGTSAATPCTSGVVAVLRSAYPNFKWYDYTTILFKTATPAVNESATSSSGVSESFVTYSTNAKGYRHSYLTGFGIVNLDQAVSVAASHSPLPTLEKYLASPLQAAGGLSISPGSCQEISWNNTSGQDFSIYSAEVSFSISGPQYRHIALWLIMSDGNKSQLKQWTSISGNGLTPSQYFKSMAPFALNAKGTWKAKVCISGSGATATLNGAQLNFFGFKGANVIPAK